MAVINKSLPKTLDPEYLNLKERELIFHYLKSILFLPAELAPLGLSALEAHIAENFSAISMKTFAHFKTDILAEMDPRGTPGQFSQEHLLRLLCMCDEV